MSNRLVLVDSSVWIGHFTGRHHAVSQALDDLLIAHRVATNAVVRVEVLTGARDETQYAELEDAFRGLHVLSLSDAVWRRAERLRFECRRVGHLIPVPDILIACCALVYHCELLHLDAHFNLLARSAPVKIWSPSLNLA